MRGLREFGEILTIVKESQIYSIHQLEQICDDIQIELKKEGIHAGAGEFFNRYYNVNWNWDRVKNISIFVKQGQHKTALRNYVQSWG